jgi:hypothetical protein
MSPVAILQVGARLQLWRGKILINAQVYNALNQRYWLPDAFNELRPQEHSTPNPGPGLSFFTSVTYRPF